MRSSNRNGLLAGGLALFLASCGGERGIAPAPGSRPAVPTAQSVVADGPPQVGKPYQVGGVTYTPADLPNYDEVGYATWYGEELQGNRTANGEAFVPSAISGAHRTLPLPSYVEVTALDTGRTILVRINDRGPFDGGKIIDLSRGAAEQLGITGGGAAAVRVRRVNPSEQERALLRAHARAPERLETPQPLLKALRGRLAGKPTAPVAQASASPKPSDRPGTSFDVPPPAKISPAKAKPTPKPTEVVKAAPPKQPATGGYVVQVAALSSRERARALAKRIGATAVEGKGVWRVRYGPYPTQAAAGAGVKAAAAKGFENVRVMANDAR